MKCRLLDKGANRKRSAPIWLTVFLSLAALAGCGKSSGNNDDSRQGELPEPGPHNQVSGSPVAHSVAEPGSTGVELAQNGSDDFFNNGTIPHFRIEADQDSLRRLDSEPRAFIRVNVQVDDAIYRDVGMHLKGRRGSFRPLASKPGLTLKFNKFRKGQRFHGMEKIHLNNAVQDPSFMTEIICSRMFREAGVPAARATNARVELNGRKIGFYVLVEGITEDFLQLYFENATGNLYDFPYAHDITSSKAKESKGRDASDLRDLASAAREPDLAKRWQRLGHVLDLDRFITYLAMEVMIWDWDCYAMCRNNYRIYHDPTADKVVFMPHGMDQIFDNPRGSILPVMKGLVARAVLETPEGRQLYFETMKSLAEGIFTAQRMTREVAELQGRIRPVLAALNPNAAARYDRAVVRLQQHIRQRITTVQQQLAHPPPEPVASTHFPN